MVGVVVVVRVVVAGVVLPYPQGSQQVAVVLVVIVFVVVTVVVVRVVVGVSCGTCYCGKCGGG